eukprot:10988280-Ditylum_brightwellii.AAC.2
MEEMFNTILESVNNQKGNDQMENNKEQTQVMTPREDLLEGDNIWDNNCSIIPAHVLVWGNTTK